MNNKVNYTMVGVAVLLGVILMLGFTYWLLKPKAEDDTQKFIVLFDESVLGLHIDSAVKYRGIDVGKVTRLRINAKNTEQVEVLVTILKTTPIKETTVAKLTSQGITGLSYINLSLGDNGAARLKAKKDEKYPIIKTEASFFERFEKSLGSVSTKLSKTLTGTEKLLDADNQKQIALLLNRSASFMSKMERLLDDQTISDFHSSMHNLASVSKKIDKLMPKMDKFIDNSAVWENKISASLSSIMSSYIGIRTTMDSVKMALDSGDYNLKEISKDMMTTINNTLIEMQHLMVRMEGAINQHERSPGDILFMQEAIKKGPGEK
ncbi:MAG: phospholipid/cholesterol/gamma-HCH transport system substrate-binding protein [Sulfurimonas sp.]|jgi:phospholipid/cholesterol/gamma-HCH transport system substrate-binding protein